MDPLIQLAFEYSPAVAVGAVIAVFVMTAVFKAMGFSGIGDKSKLVDNSKMQAVNSGVDAVKSQLGDIEKRLGAVEQDLQNRPTKEDHHRLELSFTRLEGQVMSQGMTIQATAIAINRIEEFMYQAAVRRNGGSAG